MKKVASSLVLALVLASCEETPGIPEPQVWFCSIISETVARCENASLPADGYDMLVSDMIGFIAIRPKGFGYLKTHHEILHRELNICKDKK